MRYTPEEIQEICKKAAESIRKCGEALQQLIDASKLKSGYVKVKGCDNASGYKKVVLEKDLEKLVKELRVDHPGENGYYNFLKYLWVQFPDDRKECRLDDLVPYDDN